MSRDIVLLKMIPFDLMSTCVICAGDGPGQEEILRRRYLVGLVGVATLVNRQEAGNYQAALMRELAAAAPGPPEVQDGHYG